MATNKNYSKKYYQTNKEEIKEVSRKYYHDNKEKMKKRYKEWVKTHREERKRSSKKYYDKNREICVEKSKLNILKNQTNLIEYLKDKYCEYCKSKEKLNFHHVDTLDKIFEIYTKCLVPVDFNIVLEEIKKCKILCPKCHIKEHKKYREMISKLLRIYQKINHIENIRDINTTEMNSWLDRLLSQIID